MVRKFNIELDEKAYQKLKELCKGDENAMQGYIVQTLMEKFDQIDVNPSSADKDNLKNYLNKGQPGSRNYGVKGQGW